MRSLRPTVVSLLLAFILLPSLLTAQEKLRELSEEFSRRSSRDRVEAESVAARFNLPLRSITPDGTVRELKQVRPGRMVYLKTDNLNSAKTISTDLVHPLGGAGYYLSGAGVVLGEWDGGGVRMTHQEFGGRVLSSQGAANFHSTHVAGTMIASGMHPPAKGMSFGAELRAFDWTNDLSEMATQGGLGLKASNHSYGLITGWDYNTFNDGKWAWFGNPVVSAVEDYSFGFYDAEARDWDVVAFNAPYYLIVKSAGNDRNEGPGGIIKHWVFNGGWDTVTASRSKDGNGGYDCVSSASVAKNVLTVGAVADLPGGYSVPGFVVMSSFSAWGPTDDGRIKPDIVANGVSLTSSLETSDLAYGSLSGTSMATPSVTGSVGLLLEHYQTLNGGDPILSSAMKGLVIHTADEAGGNPGPDYQFGWGLMNTRKAADLVALDNLEGAGSHIRTVEVGLGGKATIDVGSTGTEPLRATISWLDPEGVSPPTSLDPPNQILVNDVDLRIVRKSDGAVYLPWILNPALPANAATTGDNTRDNVEQVHIASPGTQEYALELRFKPSLSPLPVTVSIIVSGNTPMSGLSATADADTFEYTLTPGAVLFDSITVFNSRSTALSGFVVPDSTGFWIDVFEDSINIPPLDSQTVHFTVDGSLWTQWSTFTSRLLFPAGDTTITPLSIPVIAHVQGPTIGHSPGSFVVTLDSAETGMDTLVVGNTGFVPLDVVVTDTGGIFPSWLSANPDTFTVNPGDSVIVTLTFNPLDEPPGNYSGVLKLSSTDSATGPVLVHVFAHIGTGIIHYQDVAARWNLISLPVQPVDGLKSTLFPSAVTAAFGFGGTYYQADTLDYGQGYWIKFSGPESFPIVGYMLDADTIPLAAGWNMIGSIFDTVPVPDITTDPPGILTSEFFGYNDGYAIGDSIVPGKGYWVQASQAGNLYLVTTPSAAPKTTVRPRMDELNSLTISDASGGSQTLYFAGRADAPLKSALPPRPPKGGFDARFNDETRIASFPPAGGGQQSKSIVISNSGAEIRISAKIRGDGDGAGLRYSLRDAAGALVPLNDGTVLTIPVSEGGETSIELLSGGETLPAEFALDQNYPNPFNPSTKVTFSLPTGEMVKIALYNILGNEVATIASRRYDAGRHSVEFNAATLPSGVYIYTMRAGSFSASKKMVLMR